VSKFGIVTGNICTPHDRALVPASTYTGLWQDGDGDYEWRQLVCPEQTCWSYAIEKRSAEAARKLRAEAEPRSPWLTLVQQRSDGGEVAGGIRAWNRRARTAGGGR
jgi:hypothetical protein